MAPLLIINPRTDSDFVESVYRHAPTAVSPHALETQLRQDYPRAVVRLRELAGERTEVWYVYRDGRWTPPGSGGEDGGPK